MAVLTSEEFMTQLREILGERTDDTAIAFLENTRETLEDLHNNNNEDWKKKYEDNDASWRKRYTDTFFGAPIKPDGETKEQPDSSPKTFNDLFKEE